METPLKKTHKIVEFSLNRTMQYGNKSVDDSTQVGSEFKSYYVVWKLLCLSGMYLFLWLFKSYYVVWKLI